MGRNDTEAASQSGSTKIDRTIEKYGLEGMAKELEERWLGVNSEQESTRSLAASFNKRVLEEAIENSDAFTLSGTVDELYQSLTDDNETDATLVRSRLEQNGIDVDAVVGDFVSHQTIYRYLKDHREVEQPEQTLEERKEKAIETIQRLRGRTTTVSEQTVEKLKRNDVISVGAFSVLNDLQVLCEECGRSDDLASFLKQGGCTCRMEDAETL